MANGAQQFHAVEVPSTEQFVYTINDESDDLHTEVVDDEDEEGGEGGEGEDAHPSDSDYNEDAGPLSRRAGKAATKARQESRPNSAKSPQTQEDNQIGTVKKQKKQKNTERKKPKLAYNDYWKRIEAKDAEIERLKSLAKRYRETASSLRVVKKEEAKAKQLKLQELTVEKKQMTEKVKDLKAREKQATKQKNEMSAEIDELAAENVQYLKRDTLLTEPDDEVRRKLAIIFRDAKQLTNKWAIVKWDGVKQETVDKMGEVVMSGSLPKFASEPVRLAIKNRKLPPRVIFHAVLNRNLCYRTFVKPFSVLRNATEKGTHISEDDNLEWLFELAKEDTEAKAHRLRALILQVLSPLVPAPKRKDESAKRKRLNRLFDTHLDDIFRDTMAELKGVTKPFDEEARLQFENELTALISAFRTTALELNAQYPSVRVKFRFSLEDEKFSTPHEWLRPHRRLKLKDEEDDDEPDAEEVGLAGRQVDLVIEPAVTRDGNADGTEFGAVRILLKAVVWMVKSEDLEESSAASPTHKNRAGHPLDENTKAEETSQKPGLLAMPQSQNSATAPAEKVPAQPTSSAQESSRSQSAPASRGGKRPKEENTMPNKKRCVSLGGFQPSETTQVHNRRASGTPAPNSQTTVKPRMPEPVYAEVDESPRSSPQIEEDWEQFDSGQVSPEEVKTP